MGGRLAARILLPPWNPPGVPQIEAALTDDWRRAVGSSPRTAADTFRVQLDRSPTSLPRLHLSNVHSLAWPTVADDVRKHASSLNLSVALGPSTTAVDASSALTLGVFRSLRAFASDVLPIAVYWKTSQSLIKPSDFLMHAPNYRQFGGRLWTSVWMGTFARIATGGLKRSPELLLQSTGMKIFGLPEFECLVGERTESLASLVAMGHAMHLSIFSGRAPQNDVPLQMPSSAGQPPTGLRCRIANSLTSPNERVVRLTYLNATAWRDSTRR